MKELVGDESARGIELAVTPVVFGGFGWLLDGWLGTTPWLALALGAFALVGTVAKIWYGYDHRMRELEAQGRWARRTDAATPAVAADRDLWADRKASQA
ncbi:MAG: AtpZ/AtpI family protein [Acidimicrobiia bacterium]